jgi:iron complex transport system ATP-binding protein
MTYELNHVSVSRGNQPVLHDINLKLPRERLVGLVGPNGAGKSTLLSVMAGDLKPEGGQLLLDGAGMQVHAPADLAKQRAIMTQQSAAIFNLTVRQVLELALFAFAHWREQQKACLLTDVAKSVGVAPWLDEPMTARSWGQQQRVHFARALLQAQAAWHESGRAWLLLDEPTASQDPWHQQAMFAACRTFMSWQSVGVVVVVHDLTLAAQWCDEIVMLKAGRVVAQGDCRDVLTAQQLGQVFGEDLQVDVRWQPLPGVIMAR